MFRRKTFAVLAGACALTACAAGPGSSLSFNAPAQPPHTTLVADPESTSPDSVADDTTPDATLPESAPDAAAESSTPDSTVPVSGPAIDEVIDVGDAKPSRFYDSYLAAALADIQTWWSEQYQILFGDAYTELQGGIYAAYPERTSPIPGCGAGPESTYQEVVDAGAFYCPNGDFMAYDDGENGVIYQLAHDYGPSIVAVVMAHEFGHAIQARQGVLDRDVPTVYTEQQADCFSGAWSRRAWDGAAPGIPFTDADIELGMVALVEVRDPIGTSVLEPGGHGSAFDRIGAFQEGFYYGVGACVDLIDHPLPLQVNEFSQVEDAANNGNAPFGFEQGHIFDILTTDLSSWWTAQLAASGVAVPVVNVTPVPDPATNNCGDPAGLAASGAIYCASTREILFDQVYARELYDDFGDFSVGYVIGRAWAEAVQTALGSPLQGEARGLASDCLTGAWIGSALPDEDFDSQVHSLFVSPGDLDEAVQTALVLGDPGIHDDVSGSAFERVAHLRLGVLNGPESCYAQIQS